MAKLTTAEKKELAAAAEIPFRTLEDWNYKKKDEDYRKFILFMLNTLGANKVTELRKEYEEYIKLPIEERPF